MRDAVDEIVAAIGGNRWLRGYVRGKLRHDPVFAAALAALANCPGPVADLGCGLGLLGLWLRRNGVTVPYRGCDLSAWKIETGRAAAERWDERDYDLEAADLVSMPLAGAAAICAFDTIHYLRPDEQMRLTAKLAEAAKAGARIYLRTGVRGCGWRSAATTGEEAWTRMSGWIRGGRVWFPSLPGLCSAFEEAGCRVVEARPLWGRTPFSSHWIEVAGG